MPQPEIESLQQASEDPQIQAAVSACIAREVNAGTPQEQAIAMCQGMARDRTGGRPVVKE